MTNNCTSLETRLTKELQGEVLFDKFSRGRYSTDASIYQIQPHGVVVPASDNDVVMAVQIAADEGIPVLPRGAGTSQNGQAIGEALLIDTTKHLNQMMNLDVENRTVCVQPGMVLDQLNRYLKPHGLMFPVDVSTASRATIGGMTGNNSCGARSLRYGNMVHNVRSVEALLPDGTQAHFKSLGNQPLSGGNPNYQHLVKKLLALGNREAEEIKARFPNILRRVGGYNIDELTLSNPNMAKLLVGSEGTLAFFQRIYLDLQPIPQHKVLGVCHFPTFYQAMDSAQHLVKLKPAAVELVDRTMIDLARKISIYAPTINKYVKGEPQALLLVEFAGEDEATQIQGLNELEDLMGSLGFPNAVVKVTDTKSQSDIWEVRKSGLNIMMSMKGDGKPISFIEDCAVQLEDLAEYTRRLNEIFAKYGTTGTFYAHASVGCLHVRPVLNMKEAGGAKKMRAIAEETMEMVREYKGSHSGEHGDGISRSEFHEPMFGKRMVANFEEVKDSFDPKGLFNPGKIVRPLKMDNRKIMRFAPGYASQPIQTGMDWSAWGGLNGAIEMCNNNGACRKADIGADIGTMCPSYRVTKDEQHLTRGRANTLRLAITGQLGEDAFTSKEMYQAMDLCVSCKGCKRECPTGVDMAKMKVEFLNQYHQKHGLTLRDRLIAYLPYYGPSMAKKFAFLLNLRDQIPGIAKLTEKLTGFTARRSLPQWSRDQFKAPKASLVGDGRDVVLLADTFNSCFEPENTRAAHAVLTAAGYNVISPEPINNERPLCCGRTFFSSGMLNEARKEAERMLTALQPYIEKGVPIIGIEPSCLLTLRDEFLSLIPGPRTQALANNAFLMEEFLVREHNDGNLQLSLKPIKAKQALLHGHCYQKAFAMMSDVQQVLSLIPELKVDTIKSGCCGMAGSFGYEAEHYDTSMQMGELDLFPAVRKADSDTLIVADGTSCRDQIQHGTGRDALHIARVLEWALVSH
ncbi:MAG: FAD-binding protein [Proteobacteria bacterium]|jgi:FAD/FMN-containing dehydrogenase/Fe-S oxidoreductase|nr:FAD-binding protein [Pseudomonadota bacterium]